MSKHWIKVAGILGSLLTMPSSAVVAQGLKAPALDDIHVHQDGVTVEARPLRDRIVFCLDADKDLKISGQYGVQFRVDQKELKLWNESFPKTVTGADRYFELPLRIVLNTRGALQERHVSLDLGACLLAKYCTQIMFQITVRPPNHNANRPSTIGCMD